MFLKEKFSVNLYIAPSCTRSPPKTLNLRRCHTALAALPIWLRCRGGPQSKISPRALKSCTQALSIGSWNLLVNAHPTWMSLSLREVKRWLMSDHVCLLLLPATTPAHINLDDDPLSTSRLCTPPSPPPPPLPHHILQQHTWTRWAPLKNFSLNWVRRVNQMRTQAHAYTHL